MNQFTNQMVQNPYLQQRNSYYNMQNQNTMNQMINGIQWVQGIEGAKAYQISPNSNIPLFDSENDGIFYIKVSDNVGMCTLRAFRFEEIKPTSTQPQIDLSEYVKKTELEALINNMLGGTNNESVSGSNGQPSK